MVIRYLAVEVLRRVAAFFRRWYVDFSRAYWAKIIAKGAEFDRAFAVKIMIKTWMQPLWGDYTPIGRTMGFMFRTLRIFAAIPFFFLYFGIAFLLWILWLAVPAYLILRAITG